MKDVYITYDRYEHDEWYSVYHIGVNYDKAVRDFREHSLPDFIAYGPDDCHSFQLQRVEMSDYKYRKLRALVNASDKTEELREFMMDLYHETEYEVETIFFTDGCSDAWEIVRLYCEENGLDYDNGEEQEAAREALEDEETWNEYVQLYVSSNY